MPSNPNSFPSVPATLAAGLLLLSNLLGANTVEPPADTGPLVMSSREEHGGNFAWQMCRADRAPTGQIISRAGFDTQTWSPAIVPGTVLRSLVHNKVYPEPYFGTNNALDSGIIPDLRAVGNDFYTYWFRTEFDVPRSFAGRRVILEFGGINYRAEIWVNGSIAGQMAGMFQRGWFDVTDLVSVDKPNALAVLVRPPDVAGGPRNKNNAPGPIVENANGGDRVFGKNVTMLMSVGWDFTLRDGVRDRNTGIWRNVKLYATGPVALRHPFVKSDLPLPALTPARETVSVEATNLSRSQQTGILRGRIRGTEVSFEQQVKLEPGETREVWFRPDAYPQLVLHQPNLWWPLNKGPQHLYTLELEFVTDKSVVSDTQTVRFGIREITSDRNTPDGSRVFYVNGKRLFIRGSNWVPEAMCRGSDERTYAELRYTQQAGINLLRLWGGGIAESDAFYDRCDEMGILVWNEFWLTGDTLLPNDTELYRANFADTLKRIRNHPSNAYYVSANEREDGSIIPVRDMLSALDDTIGYQSGSEVDGIHDGSPYKFRNPMFYYDDTASDRGSRINGFCPEYGTWILPTVESLRRMMDSKDLWPINKSVWNYMDGGGFHDVTTEGDLAIQQFGRAKSIDGYAWAGQIVGAAAYRALWENWNANMFEFGKRFSTGLLFWYHNNPNPQVCGRFYDYFLEPTAALYYTQNALAPQHAQFDFIDNTVGVFNDRPVPLRGRVRARIYNFDLSLKFERTEPISVPAEAMRNGVMKVAVPTDLSAVHFIKLDLFDEAGTLISDTFYWRSTDAYQGPKTRTGPLYGGFHELTKLQPADVEITVQQQAGGDCRVVLENTGATLAFFTQLRVVDRKSGKSVQPVFYSDNFVSLFPGEQKLVRIEAKGVALDACDLIVEGWNVPAKRWSNGKVAIIRDSVLPCREFHAPAATLAKTP